jgi:nucleoside-diphosphate-sugar epimerase
LLIVGCGDVGMRMVNKAAKHLRLLVLTTSAQRIDELRAKGCVPLLGDLDKPQTLRRLAGLANRIVHLAPPPLQGWTDPRTLALTRALRTRTTPVSFVYGSTSGVYGDCCGDWIDETRLVNPDTPRARRRVHAESCVRFFGRSTAVTTSVLRIPGIYANDREGGTPRDRLLKGTPVLQASDDVYTNHIHADDLAAACMAAVWRAKPQRIYNCNDDTAFKMGDYFDFAADLYGLPRPARVAREGAREQLPLMLLSFMSESRRMRNDRLKQELGVRLQYPTVREGLALP